MKRDSGDFEIGPSFDLGDVERLEEVAASNGVGINRRVSLCVHTKSVDELADLALRDPETFKEMLSAVRHFYSHLSGALEIAKAAEARLALASAAATGTDRELADTLRRIVNAGRTTSKKRARTA
jgi:hypothetical protein